MGLRGTIIDISTGQRRAHRRIADADILGTLLWNAAGDITGANDVFLAMLGYTRSDFAAGRLKWDELTPSECAEEELTARTQLLRCGAVTPSEKELCHRDGSRGHVLGGAATLDDASGDGMTSILHLPPPRSRVREDQPRAIPS